MRARVVLVVLSLLILVAGHIVAPFEVSAQSSTFEFVGWTSETSFVLSCPQGRYQETTVDVDLQVVDSQFVDIDKVELIQLPEPPRVEEGFRPVQYLPGTGWLMMSHQEVGLFGMNGERVEGVLPYAYDVQADVAGALISLVELNLKMADSPTIELGELYNMVVVNGDGQYIWTSDGYTVESITDFQYSADGRYSSIIEEDETEALIGFIFPPSGRVVLGGFRPESLRHFWFPLEGAYDVFWGVNFEGNVEVYYQRFDEEGISGTPLEVCVDNSWNA